MSGKKVEFEDYRFENVPEELSFQPFFFGFLPMEWIPQKSVEKSGSLNLERRFFFRAVFEENKIVIVFSVYFKNYILNYRVGKRKINGNSYFCFLFEKRGFKTLSSLIQFYSKKNQMLGKTELLGSLEQTTVVATRAQMVLHDLSHVGEGTFGHVELLKQIIGHDEQRSVAVKSCNDPEPKMENHRKAVLSMLHEIRILASLDDYTYITKFHGICVIDPIPKVMLEYCQFGSLDNVLSRKDTTDLPSPVERLIFCHDICQGMLHLADRKIVHRDLAARNCLISRRGIVQIADFGMSNHVCELENLQIDKDFRAPLRWVAPECLGKNPKYSSASDVWSFGMTMFEIYSDGMAPYFEENDCRKIARKIRKGDKPTHPKHSKMEKDILDLMISCWQKKAKLRPGFKEILKKILEIGKNWAAPAALDRCFVPTEEMANELLPRTPIAIEKQNADKTLIRVIDPKYLLKLEKKKEAEKEKNEENREKELEMIALMDEVEEVVKEGSGKIVKQQNEKKVAAKKDEKKAEPKKEAAKLSKEAKQAAAPMKIVENVYMKPQKKKKRKKTKQTSTASNEKMCSKEDVENMNVNNIVLFSSIFGRHKKSGDRQKSTCVSSRDFDVEH
uniref:Non-specific protein-tyrosine kinase n=1 Tax=Panagrolaimus sp. JU765 TaxID=591449 RepID=A0AC34QDW7_9BILA